MPQDPAAQTANAPEGWVLYDAACGICARWVPSWAPRLARLGLGTAPLQAPWVAARTRASPEALARDIRLLFADGRELVGADVYRYVLRRLWWAYPLYVLAVAPGLRRLVDRAYRAFADHRRRLSAACGLQPPASAGTGAVAPPAEPRPGHRRACLTAGAGPSGARPGTGLGGPRPFLDAEWRDLVILTYAVPPEILAPCVPPGTVLDLWQGRALASVVGLRFRDVRLLGVPVPLHRAFDEVNLRFYVCRALPGGELRRGVVFLRELVPRPAVALVARLAYGEPYRVARMPRAPSPEAAAPPRRIEYRWRWGGAWHRLAATPTGRPAVPAAGSEAAFLTERHWGYARRADGRTLEYAVAHPPWRVWAGGTPVLEADAGRLWAAPFAGVLNGPPVSALVAEGSPVAVGWRRTLAGSDERGRGVRCRASP
jgi:hypothetical protein